MKAAPAAVLIQKRLSRCARESVLAWMAAEESPKSRKISATPMMAVTIATSP